MATPTISADGVVRINVRIEHRVGLDDLGHLVALVLTTHHHADGMDTVARRPARWWRSEVADLLRTFGEDAALQEADDDIDDDSELVIGIVGRVWPELLG